MSAQGFGIHRSLQIGYFGQTLVCVMLDYKEFFLYKLASLRKNYPIFADNCESQILALY